MALWMETGSKPRTESEKADIEGISALKEIAALELKDKGNGHVKMGKKNYRDAIDCYTRAINQEAVSNSESSVMYANRAQVNLLLGNYRRALTDSEEAIKLNPRNVKAFYRAGKAALSLDLLTEAKSFCEKGLEGDSHNDALRALETLVDSRISEYASREIEASRAVSSAEEVVSAIEHRRLQISRPMFQELTGVKKPFLDSKAVLHWPALLLYPEVMSSDFIEDFCEADTFTPHLDIIFSDDCAPMAWDRERAYTRGVIELYYEAFSGTPLSRAELVRYMLEGTPGSELENGDDEGGLQSFEHGGGATGMSNSRWIKVDEKRSMYDVLTEGDFIIPSIPVFYVISKKTKFYELFLEWKMG